MEAFRRTRRRSRDESTSVEESTPERRVTRRCARLSGERGVELEEVDDGDEGELGSRLTSVASLSLPPSDPPASTASPSFHMPPPRMVLSLHDYPQHRRLRGGTSALRRAATVPRVCHLSDLSNLQGISNPSAADEPVPGSPRDSHVDGSSIRAPSRAASLPASHAGSLPVSLRSACSFTSSGRRSGVVETPPCGERAFEAHALLVACPAPRRRASNLAATTRSDSFLGF